MKFITNMQHICNFQCEETFCFSFFEVIIIFCAILESRIQNLAPSLACLFILFV
jgi:hypothetical protein